MYFFAYTEIQIRTSVIGFKFVSCPTLGNTFKLFAQAFYVNVNFVGGNNEKKHKRAS